MTNHEKIKSYSARQYAEYEVMLDILKEVKDINITMSMLKLPKYQNLVEEMENWLKSEVKK